MSAGCKRCETARTSAATMLVNMPAVFLLLARLIGPGGMLWR